MLLMLGFFAGLKVTKMESFKSSLFSNIEAAFNSALKYHLHY